MATRRPPAALTLSPIGVIRTPFRDRASTPRQPAAARGVAGTIELSRDGRFEHALSDLATFSHVWVLFWFHLSTGWKSRVRPPRSPVRRGVFATRSPHRPNPIGMSVLRLEGIQGTTLSVLDVDMVDGTPLLDLKPYLPYTDAIAGAGHGWLAEEEDPGAALAPGAPGAAADPGPAYVVTFAARAGAQAAWLAARGVDLLATVTQALSLGPAPHPYRRIRREGDGFVLAVREWRARFTVSGKAVTVQALRSGYRPSQIYGGEGDLAVHRDFTERFGADGMR